jgi:hypothetical protein
VTVVSGELVRGVERFRRPAIASMLCVAVLAVPATAAAAGSMPLRPDPSPVAETTGPQPDAARSPSTASSATPPVRPAAPAAAPVAAARVVTTTRSASGSFRPPAVSATRPPAVRATTAKHRAAAKAPMQKPKPSRLAPLRLGVRYALAPPRVRALTDEHLPLLAAWALLVFLLASGSFLGLAYRLRRESLGI